MSSGEPDTGNLERHYRVVLDFRVLVRGITPEVCRESFFFKEAGEPAGESNFLEHVERQRRVYKLLRADQELMELYLLTVLTQAAGNFVYQGLPEAFGVRDEDELMESLFGRMAREDAQFFEECLREGILAENTELIGAAFKVDWVGAEVEEMTKRVAGDVRRAEIASQAKTRVLRKLNQAR